jgi:hypothetical protein
MRKRQCRIYRKGNMRFFLGRSGHLRKINDLRKVGIGQALDATGRFAKSTGYTAKPKRFCS